jgi:hypothetical protein
MQTTFINISYENNNKSELKKMIIIGHFNFFLFFFVCKIENEYFRTFISSVSKNKRHNE